MTTFEDLEQKIDIMKQAAKRMLQATKELKEVVSKSWIGGNMEEVKYFVEINGDPVAKDMSLKDATIFVRALFEEYWNDKKLFVSIRRMDWDKPDCMEK